MLIIDGKKVSLDLKNELKASVVGTGRSDLLNQVNNALVFPGLFKGLC